MKHLLVIPLFIILSLLSCSKDDTGFNCDSLRKGLLNTDRAMVQTEVNKVLNGLIPNPITSDPSGHLENLNTFMTVIQGCNEITCDLDCYNCFHELLNESV